MKSFRYITGEVRFCYIGIKTLLIKSIAYDLTLPKLEDFIIQHNQ